MSRRCNKTDCDVAGGPWNGAEMPRRFTVHEHSLYRCVCVCVCVWTVELISVDAIAECSGNDRRLETKQVAALLTAKGRIAAATHRIALSLLTACEHPLHAVLRITTGRAKHWGHRLMTIIL